jgi:hypothetical protein
MNENFIESMLNLGFLKNIHIQGRINCYAFMLLFFCTTLHQVYTGANLVSGIASFFIF